MQTTTVTISLEDLVDLCRAYSGMGWAVREQLDDLLIAAQESPDALRKTFAENVNSNAYWATDGIRDFLVQVADADLDEATEQAATIIDVLDWIRRARR